MIYFVVNKLLQKNEKLKSEGGEAARVILFGELYFSSDIKWAAVKKDE